MELENYLKHHSRKSFANIVATLLCFFFGVVLLSDAVTSGSKVEYAVSAVLLALAVFGVGRLMVMVAKRRLFHSEYENKKSQQ